MSRFERQVILPGFGTAAQNRLKKSKILVVGAGGLGAPLLLYLAAAGIGEITIIDGDTVSESNLNRQILYGYPEIGKPKAASAAAYLQQKYPDIGIKAIETFITTQNAVSIFSDHDLVIDGTDNFSTRYLLSDGCYLLQKPLVSGSIYKFEGQIIVLDAQKSQTRPLTYRDLYPRPPAPEEVPNCSEIGVLGVLPGIIGTIMASEAIKLISNYAPAMANKVLFYNLLQNSFYETSILENPEALADAPQTIKDFEQMNYATLCGLSRTISWHEVLQAIIQKTKNILIVDVRNPDELPKPHKINYLNIPLTELECRKEEVSAAETIYVFCQAGVRSQKAAQFLERTYPNKKVFSIEGGINQLQSTLHIF